LSFDAPLPADLEAFLQEGAVSAAT
jgi:hypothetical protein